MEDFEYQLKFEFLDEAADLLEMANRCWVDLDSGVEMGTHIDEIFRYIHSVKGGAHTVGFGQLGTYAHKVENFIAEMRTGEQTIAAEAVAVMLACNDIMVEMVEMLREDFSQTLEFTDPLAELESGSVRVSESNEIANQGKTNLETPTNSTTGSHSVLVVDDEELLRQKLEELVLDMGIECRTASNGHQALSILKEGYSPSAVVLDLQMPGMNGIELAQKVNELDPTIGILICSGHIDQEKLRALRKIGIMGYLDKPIEHRTMQMLVHLAIESTCTRRVSADLSKVNYETYRNIVRLVSTLKSRTLDWETRQALQKIENHFTLAGHLSRKLTSGDTG